MEEARWHRLMTSLGMTENSDTWRNLVSAYSEPHRHYHTGKHIEHCLSLMLQQSALAEKPHTVELALWFHDAVYNPLKTDNETASADWVCRFLHQNNREDLCKEVRGLIMATCHNTDHDDNDAQLVVDIDLAILGVDTAEYQIFESNIRREYHMIPDFIFRRKRRKILQSFLQRKSIYHHRYFQQQFEDQARKNLEMAITSLK